MLLANVIDLLSPHVLLSGNTLDMLTSIKFRGTLHLAISSTANFSVALATMLRSRYVNVKFPTEGSMKIYLLVSYINLAKHD